MKESISFAEAVWLCLKDEFGSAAACGTIVAEAMKEDGNKVATTLYALAKRHAVIEAGKDPQGRLLYKANLNAKFRRPRADKGVATKKREEKPAKRKTPTTRAALPVPAPLDPSQHYAVDGTWHVLINNGQTTVRISPTVALALRDFIDQLSPALEAAQ